MIGISKIVLYGANLGLIWAAEQGSLALVFEWNRTFKKCKQLFEYQHLLLIRVILLSKF
jgi:hypothetical protein